MESMKTHTKTLLAGLILMVVLCTAGIGSAQDVSDTNDLVAAVPDSNQPTIEPNEPNKPAAGNINFFSTDPNLVVGGNQNMETRDLFYRAMFAVLLVLVLGAGAIYLSRRFLPRLAKLSGKQIRVIETVHLGQHKSLHLVNVEGRKILLGSTVERISKLVDLNDFAASFDLTGEDTDSQ